MGQVVLAIVGFTRTAPSCLLASFKKKKNLGKATTFEKEHHR